jgi:hypothetical protein
MLQAELHLYIEDFAGINAGFAMNLHLVRMIGCP